MSETKNKDGIECLSCGLFDSYPFDNEDEDDYFVPL